MDWPDLFNTIDSLVLKCASVSRDVRRETVPLFLGKEAGYYYHPQHDLVGVYAPQISPQDLALAKAACEAAVGQEHTLGSLLSLPEVTDGSWVKVAYSHALRRAGELLNFFPGQYPGGIPNAPSPLAAMLTTGIVGGGLGYGAGKLAEKFLPRHYGKHLGRTGALVGAALGAAPGAAWAAGNHSLGQPMTTGWPLNEYDHPVDDPAMATPDGMKEVAPWKDDPMLTKVKLGSAYRAAVNHFVKRADLPGFAPQAAVTPYDVNIDYLGQTLWQGGATPQLAGSTMGAMYAAQQLPDPNSRQGWATANQLGQLAMNAGKDYLTGAAVGAVLNAAVGTPYSAGQFGGGMAALGLIGAVIPKLF